MLQWTPSPPTTRLLRSGTADAPIVALASMRSFAAVAADLLNTNTRRNLAMLLTQRLAQLTRVRTVRLNEISGSMSPRSLQPVRVRDYVAYAVPVREEGRQVMLEAAFDARNGPDDWTCQLLEGGRQPGRRAARGGAAGHARRRR